MSQEIADKFLQVVASCISPEVRTDERVYGLASGIVLGLQLSQRHPEYGVALLRECQEVLTTQEEEVAFVDLIVETVPIERIEGNGT